MLLPLRDMNPRHRFPAAMVAVLLVNVAIFAFQLSLPAGQGELLVRSAGAIPFEILHHVDLPPRSLLPIPFTILSSMFLHGGVLHLLGNMWFLWIFGDNIEDRLGSLRCLLFYLLTGTIGAIAQCLANPGATVPMIGASGAVAGILGAYVLVFPHAQVKTLVAIPFLWHVRMLPAWVFLGLWFLGQFLIGEGSNVAWMAHVGGFLGGLGLVRLFEPKRDSRAIVRLNP